MHGCISLSSIRHSAARACPQSRGYLLDWGRWRGALGKGLVSQVDAREFIQLSCEGGDRADQTVVVLASSVMAVGKFCVKLAVRVNSRTAPFRRISKIFRALPWQLRMPSEHLLAGTLLVEFLKTSGAGFPWPRRSQLDGRKSSNPVLLGDF